MDSSSIKNEFLKEIDKLADQNIQSNDDCVSVYDLYQVIKGIKKQKDELISNFKKKIKELKDILYLENVNVFQYTMDVYPYKNILRIEANKKEYGLEVYTYKVSVVFSSAADNTANFNENKNWYLESGYRCLPYRNEENDFELGYDILDKMGDYSTSFLDSYFELSDNSFFKVLSSNLNLEVEIADQKINIKYKNSKFDINDLTLDQIKTILVKIDDCPKVIQKEIYHIKRQQLKELFQRKLEELNKNRISMFSKLGIKLNIINKDKFKMINENKNEIKILKEQLKKLDKKEIELYGKQEKQKNKGMFEYINKRIEEELKNYTIIENNTLSENVPIKAFAYYADISTNKIYVKKNGYWVRILYHDLENWLDSDCVEHFDNICDAKYELTNEEIKCIKNFISEDKKALELFSDYIENKGKSYDASTEDRSLFEPSRLSDIERIYREQEKEQDLRRTK